MSNGIAKNTSSITHFDFSRILPRKLQFEIDLKRRLRSRWQRTRDADLKTFLNRQTTKVKNLMADHRNNQWSNLLGSLNGGSNAWTRFYRLNRVLIRKPQPSRPLKGASGNIIFDPKSKAELLADSLELQFRSPPGNANIDSSVHDKLFHQRTLPSTSTSFFSPAEVWNVVKSLLSRRAPGQQCT